ncbi:TonB-dependent receptor [Endozoicomonas sp. SM1973]|uniref:TonB-dependent receptor n=1 Tax=Spartinivicinus marinus TaxID=2994442 RepID=A0A853I7S2_9GAMM|nr:TonB-dependent receptor [Spartinivicinus marinus]MCX4029132.1 TonB-dependent receptor [Spartinivicinus marinus]NYZ67752.1 TonB-dependent receptor [Spartinivicinus marinus]
MPHFTPKPLFVSLFIAGQAIAANEAPVVLDEIVVTPTLTPTTVANSLAPVTLFTREAIEKSQAQDLPELLKRVPGLDVQQSGGTGSTTRIFSRGTATRHTLVLIDGIRINQPTSGQGQISLIDLDSVERVEIVRGPKAAIYGAAAMGAVINIITRKDTDKTLAPELKITRGSHKTEKYAGGISGKIEDTFYSLKLGYHNTEGFNRRTDDSRKENDGYRNNSINAYLKHNFSEKTSLSAYLFQNKGETELDFGGQNNQFTEFTIQTIGTELTHQFNDSLDLKLGVSQSKDFADFLNEDNSFPSQLDIKSYSRVAQLNWKLNEHHLLTTGYEYIDDHIVGSTSLTKRSRYNHAYFIQDQITYGNHDIIIGLRHEDNEQFGHHTSKQFSYGYWINDDLQVIASYGESFAAPNFNDLYSQDTFYRSNPNLKPEQAKHYELALKGFSQSGRWRVGIFETQIEDLIINKPFPSSGFIRENVNQAEIHGIEAELTTELLGWNYTTSLTLLDPKDKDTDSTLRARSKQLVNMSLNKTWNRYTLGVEWFLQGKRHNASFNSRDDLPGFGTVNLLQSYKLSDDITLQWKINNIFDKDYETNKGFEEDGINTLISLIYRPN